METKIVEGWWLSLHLCVNVGLCDGAAAFVNHVLHWRSIPIEMEQRYEVTFGANGCVLAVNGLEPAYALN